MIRPSEILTRDELRRLSKSRNAPPLFNLAMRVVTHTALLWLALVVFQAGFYVIFAVLALVNAAIFQFVGYAGLSHELFHGKVFENKSLNRRLFTFTSYLMWNNPAFFEKSHGYHHAHTFADDDAEAHSHQPFNRLDWVFYLTVDLRMFWRRMLYLMLNSIGKTVSFRPFALSSLGPKSEAITTHARQILLLQLALLAGWVLLAGPVAGVIFWLTPFTATAPNRLLAASQHIGLSAYKNAGPLGHSRTLVLPRWLSGLYAGMNYHCEHHLFPGIPYYNLPELHKNLVEKGLLEKEENLSFFLTEFWIFHRELDLSKAV